MVGMVSRDGSKLSSKLFCSHLSKLHRMLSGSDPICTTRKDATLEARGRQARSALLSHVLRNQGAESEKNCLPCLAKGRQDRRRAERSGGSRFGPSQERVMFWRHSQEKLYWMQTRYKWGQMQAYQLRRKLELLRA